MLEDFVASSRCTRLTSSLPPGARSPHRGFDRLFTALRGAARAEGASTAFVMSPGYGEERKNSVTGRAGSKIAEEETQAITPPSGRAERRSSPLPCRRPAKMAAKSNPRCGPCLEGALRVPGLPSSRGRRGSGSKASLRPRGPSRATNGGGGREARRSSPTRPSHGQALHPPGSRLAWRSGGPGILLPGGCGRRARKASASSFRRAPTGCAIRAARIRTGTPLSRQRVLSTPCLPFHHDPAAYRLYRNPAKEGGNAPRCGGHTASGSGGGLPVTDD